MANITYPNGVGSWQTLVSAYDLTTSPTAVGSIQLGDASSPYGQVHAPEVVLSATSVKNSSSTLVLAFQVSNDDTTYYTVAEYAWSHTMAGTEVTRFALKPFSRTVKYLKVLASTGSVGATAGTLTLKARLAGSHKPVTTS